MTRLLIIFVKNPKLGEVKSRLAKSIGDAKALSVYKKLLKRTRELTLNLQVDKLVCYSNCMENNDIWENDNFQKEIQEGKDLGEKMFNAILNASKKSYEEICLIGSDNMELTSKIIDNSFNSLVDHDVVIGPTKDGGYYLIGMKVPIERLFQNKKWGTSSVFNETMQDIKEMGFDSFLLPKLNDIDVVEDIAESDRVYLLH